MIVHINLAPEIKEEANIKELAPSLAIAALVLALFYGAPMLYADSVEDQADEVAAKTQEKKDQLAALELDLNKIKTVQAAINDLEGRKQMILSLTDARKQPVAVLETLQDLQLDRMWLDLLDYKTNLMQIKGWASDYGVISEFVRRIKVTNGSTEQTIDTENFTPTFESTPAPAEVASVKRTDAVPVKFTDIMLKDSTMRESNESPTNLPIQVFEIEFNPNIESAGVR